MAKSDIVADILQAMPESNRSRPWWEKAAPEHQKTINAIAEAWRSGQLGPSRNRAAAAISTTLGQRGIATVGRQGVLLWLNRLQQS
jgi:hypothetical protein